MSTYAKPFLKWVGGKGQLIPELLKHIPSTWDYEKDAYVEPFLGGGALFFALQPKHAILGDANTQLIDCYISLKEDCDDIIARLLQIETHYRQDPEKTYYDIRAAGLCEDFIQNAAEFIFINKTGFNGLYRVNRKGECNTPWGRNPEAKICDVERLRQCSAILNAGIVKFEDSINLNSQDYAPMFRGNAHPLFYFDPPYLPVTSTASFTKYTQDGFTYTDQIKLLNLAIGLREQGAHILVSQGSGPHGDLLVQQYARCGFKIHQVQARRAINRDGSKRGAVGEYIISS